MGSFSFLHAADVHLDSPLKGLSGQEGRVAERIRTAPRAAFEQLIDLAISEAVDFVVIAGDLYDGTWRDYSTGLYFAEQMGRLNQVGTPVFLLYGNHDAESQITKPLVLPDNVKVFGTRKPETYLLDELGVALHGQSFRHRDITDNLAASYPSPVDGFFNIGVLHTGLGGMGGHAAYAPCSLQELVARGYAYWALGHVHQAAILNEHPHIVFPGNLQGRHVREAGAKGACLVTVEGGQVSDIIQVPLDVVRWAVLPVEVTSADTVGDVVDRFRMAISEAARDAEGRLLACRIELRGVSKLHERLLTGAAELLAEVRSAALGLGEDVAWVESVIAATSPVADLEGRAVREDAVGDLLKMLKVAPDDSALMASIKDDIGGLVRVLQNDVRDDAEDEILQCALRGDHAALIEQVAPYLIARLSAEDH